MEESSDEEDEEDDDTRAERRPASRESDPEPFPSAIHRWSDNDDKGEFWGEVSGVVASSSGMEFTVVEPNSNIEPRRPTGGRLGIPSMPDNGSGPPSSMSKTAPGAGGDSGPLVWCNEDSELARESCTEPELSRRNSPITEAILGCSIPPKKERKGKTNH